MDPNPLFTITKMSGSGNDFILTDNRSGQILDSRMATLTRSLCRRMVSVGADGLIFIGPSDRYDFKWRFFNADGSEAEMCGNGGRCAARFAYLKGIAGKEMAFETLAGPIQAWVEGSKVKIQLTRPQGMKSDQTIMVGQEKVHFDFINTGVPHAVIWVEDAQAADLAGTGPRVRFHEFFKPAGTNVNFVQVLEPGWLRVRTYERGVEGETLACGTGAVASASFAFLKKNFESPIRLRTQGGEILTVYLEGQPGKHIDQVYLEGEVRLIFQGEVFEEALKE